MFSYLSEKNKIDFNTRVQMNDLFRLAAEYILVGSESLELTSCKIKDKILFWKLDNDSGYLAIDPTRRVLFCTDTKLTIVDFYYNEFPEHVASIVTALDFRLFLYNNDRLVAKPGRIEDERLVILKSTVCRIASEIIGAGDKMGFTVSKIVDDQLFISNEGTYLVIRPREEEWLGRSSNTNPANFKATTYTFSYLIFLRSLLNDCWKSAN